MSAKVCTNPACTLGGIPQPLDNFYRQRVKGKLYYGSRCKTCVNAASLGRHHSNMQRPEYQQLRREAGLRSYQQQKRKRLARIMERVTS